MKLLLLSVRAKLLFLCLGLVISLSSANLLLGYLISQDEPKEQALAEQYRRFEVVQETERASTWYRHTYSQVIDAILLHDADAEAKANVVFAQSQQRLDRALLRLAAFDPERAKTIRSAIEELPEYVKRVVQGLASGDQKGAEPAAEQMQQRLDLIEATLDASSIQQRAISAEIQRRERQRVARATEIAGMIIVLTGIIGVMMTMLMVRSIIHPLAATTNAIRQVNAGRTDIDLPPITADEFGDMAVALRQFREQAERLRKIAYEDALTGVGNRARLEETLQQALDRALEQNTQVAVMYIDIDNFRAINDRLGHRVGDRYLCEAVQRMARCIPAGALLCRFGGDKFTILIESLPTGQSAEPQLRQVADGLLRGLSAPYVHGEHVLNMSASIGIAVYPRDGETVEQLISGSDAAMFAAKRGGRNNVRFANSEVTAALRRHLSIANDVRRGLENGEFEPFYQPIVDTERGVVVGAEALIRWRHPERGFLLPASFIDVAEDTGLIGLIGKQCLLAAHRQVCQWRDHGRQLRVSVNLSARQLQDEQILDVLQQLKDIDRDGAAQLDLELTESALVEVADFGENIAGRIRALGFRLGLDDFGTGYSSFSYLRLLPIDKIKIDRQFVASMATSRQSMAIISAIMALSKSLEMEVIAEGIEAVEHVRALRKLGCTLHQGYFFSPALPAGEFESWVAKFERQAAADLVDGVLRPALIR